MGRYNYLPELDFHPGQNLTPEDFGLNLPNTHWNRLIFILYLMGTTGFSIRREITLLASRPMNTSPDSNTLRRLCDMLTKASLIETKKLPLVGASTVNVVRLTEIGKTICRRYGWDVNESEWEHFSLNTAADYHPHYLSLALEFAFQVRQRREKVIKAAPTSYQGHANDLPELIISNGGGYELPVYILGNTDPRRKFFENLFANKDGQFGIVSLNERWRGIQKRNAVLSSKRGYITDIETLVLKLRSKEYGPIWIEEFSG